MKKHNKYKPSGIKWIGDIPKHWEVIKLKYLINYKKGKIPKLIDAKKEDNKPVYLSMEYLRDNFEQIQYAEDCDNCVKVKDKDPLLLWDGSNAGEFIEGKNGILSSTMVKIEYIKNTNSRYGWFLLKTFEKELKNSTYGMGIPHVSSLFLKNLFLPNIPILEQTQIVTYLDQKTTQIDQTITQKEKLIKLYEEEKKAIINQAVTKGLNNNVKLTPSGIEWLGDIPEHWEVKRFKYYFDLITKKDKNGTKKIGLENVESETGNFIETNTVFEGDGVEFFEDDILYGKLRPYLAKVYLAKFNGSAVGDFYIFRCLKEVIPEFAKYRFLDYSFIDVTNSSTYGAKMPRVSWDFIANLVIAFPPTEEQTQIVNHIEAQSNRLNQAITKAKKEIELIKEYRQALIFEAVTGKIDVREETV